jgi:hypothetical protein
LAFGFLACSILHLEGVVRGGVEAAAVNAALWVVGKALDPVKDGLLEAWAATTGLAPNVRELKLELLYAQAMLDDARDREPRSPALVTLLHELRHLAYSADDVLGDLESEHRSLSSDILDRVDRGSESLPFPNPSSGSSNSQSLAKFVKHFWSGAQPRSFVSAVRAEPAPIIRVAMQPRGGGHRGGPSYDGFGGGRQGRGRGGREGFGP